MKALVIFDSNYGNTRKVAEAIAAELGSDVRALAVSGLDVKELEGLDLLVVGSPIHARKPSAKMESFLASLKKDQLKGIKAAAFDTRVKLFHGDAAGKIVQILKGAGAEIIAEPEGFTVQGKEGPLATGEVPRATEWARSMKAKAGPTGGT